MGCLRIGMAVSGFQPLKSPAIVIVCAPGALDALRENSTLYGRAGLGFVTVGGIGVVEVGAVDGGRFCIGTVGVGVVRGQKK